MDLECYETLGRKIETLWVNRDEREFPDIAGQVLTAFEPEDFDLTDVGHFLLSTRIPQQPKNPFSDLPVTVFRGDGFCLELLFWTRSTTAIHQHSFSGAFRVLVGSSLHTDYIFRERQRISSRLLIGDVEATRMRLLRVGDVLPINSGRSGLIHALFHLDEPSVTLVARTYHDDDSGPQYSLLKPRFAFDLFWADNDNRILILRRWIALLSNQGRNGVPRAVLDEILRLDPARLFAIVLHHADLFPESVADGNFWTKLNDKYPDLACGLKETLRHEKDQSSLTKTRLSVKDPGLRFFIALLMNAPTREHVLGMVTARNPQVDAERQCIEWLLRLGEPGNLAWGSGDQAPLLLRLSMALGVAGAFGHRMIESFVRGKNAEWTLAEMRGESPEQFERLAQANRAICTAPELALFRRD